MIDIAINFMGILNISIYKAKGDALIGDNYSGLKVVDHVKKKVKNVESLFNCYNQLHYLWLLLNTQLAKCNFSKRIIEKRKG